MKLKTDSCSIGAGKESFSDFFRSYRSLNYFSATLSGYTVRDIYLLVPFLPRRQIDGDGGTCSVPSCNASQTAGCCCAGQQLPDQIRAAGDCIVWCHFKIQEHFKIHFSHLSAIYEEHRSML